MLTVFKLIELYYSIQNFVLIFLLFYGYTILYIVIISSFIIYTSNDHIHIVCGINLHIYNLTSRHIDIIFWFVINKFVGNYKL